MAVDDENKIEITTNPRFYGRPSVKEPAITFDSLQAAVLETYEQAHAIGWETNVLDALSAWIRRARNSADKA